MVLTKTLIRESEEMAVKSGAFSFTELMGIAGEAAAKIILERFDVISKKVAVVCGCGNNGGDGCVVAKVLYEHGADVTAVFPLGTPKTDDALYYYNKLGSVNKAETLFGDYDFVIDALFGIGLDRPLENSLCELIKQLNGFDATRIAIDIPSGIDADTGHILGTCFNADLTITFIALKPCFMLPDGSDFCGEVVVADIGVKPISQSYFINKKPIFEKRRRNSHKGTFGTATLIVGSYGMAGAAILAARASLRSGVGIAKCILCESIYPAFTAAVPEAVVIPSKQAKSGTLSCNFDIAAVFKKTNALLFGCGIGISEDSEKILENIILSAEIPLVIDADGINILSRRIDLLSKRKAQLILTPHPAEMARLCNTTTAEIEQNRVKYAKDFAQKHNCILILKGADTIIAEPNGEITFNLNGNPGMAKGGSGDVLAGILVSLLAQGLSPVNAAKAAVYLHGEAGDKAAVKKGERAMLPSDIINEL